MQEIHQHNGGLRGSLLRFLALLETTEEPRKARMQIHNWLDREFSKKIVEQEFREC